MAAPRPGAIYGSAHRPHLRGRPAEQHGPCGQPAGWHTDHPGYGRCSWHGGAAPNGVKAAAEEQAYTQAREELAKLDVRPVGNPLEALQKLGGQVVAWQEACARLVNKLTDDQVRYPGSLRGEQIRAEIGMYQDALRQSASVLTSLAKLDIDERLTAIQERDAALIVGALAWEDLARWDHERPGVVPQARRDLMPLWRDASLDALGAVRLVPLPVPHLGEALAVQLVLAAVAAVADGLGAEVPPGAGCAER